MPFLGPWPGLGKKLVLSCLVSIALVLHSVSWRSGRIRCRCDWFSACHTILLDRGISSLVHTATATHQTDPADPTDPTDSTFYGGRAPKWSSSDGWGAEGGFNEDVGTLESAASWANGTGCELRRWLVIFSLMPREVQPVASGELPQLDSFGWRLAAIPTIINTFV